MIVVLHDALYGFREGRGTATLEANLEQHLTGLEHEPLLQVFLDFLKAYNLLDRERRLKILRRYGMGMNLARLLENYWKRQRIFPKVGKCLGKSCGTYRGVTQVNPESLMIFKIVVDAVVRLVLGEVCSLQEAQHAMGWAAG